MNKHFEKLILLLVLFTNFLAHSQIDENEDIAYDTVAIANPYHFNKNVNYFAEPELYLDYHPDSVVKMATRYLGTPYKASGKSPKGFDCAGFVFYIYKKFGIYLPYSSLEIAEIGKSIIPSEAQRGDLILFKGADINSNHAGHVGIVISKLGTPVKFIHSSTSKGIKIDNLANNRYFEPRYMAIRRIIETK